MKSRVGFRLLLEHPDHPLSDAVNMHLDGGTCQALIVLQEWRDKVTIIAKNIRQIRHDFGVHSCRGIVC